MIEHWVCSLSVLQYLSVVEKSVTFGVCMRDKREEGYSLSTGGETYRWKCEGNERKQKKKR